jgi:membrane-associated phospholipid phosphatase
VLSLFWLKFLGTSGGIALFFWAYFWVLRHPLGATTVMPAIWLDYAIGVQPWSFALYVTLWVYISLGTALARDLRELGGFGLASLGMGVVGLGAFLLVPTRVAEPAIDWTLYPSLYFLKSVDAPGNACPSLHAAFCVFTWAVLHTQLKAIGAPRLVLAANALWGLGILYSTVATGQHVVLDVIAGAALGGVAAAGYRAFAQGANSAIGIKREEGAGLQ